MKNPGPDHPIGIAPTLERVTVRLGERIIADTAHALTLSEAGYPAVQYIPFTDVDQRALRSSATATTCPYKGEASYYSLVTDDAELTDAVWVYRDPYPAVAQIAGHLAFDPGQVQVNLG